MVTCINKEFQSYYTYSTAIVKYMTDLLEPAAGLKYLEPAAGDGIFIEPLISYPNISIDAFDIDPHSIEGLIQKFKYTHNVNIFHKDTLIEMGHNLFSKPTNTYDRIIANPPYGAWQDYEKRNYLKNLYPDFYVKETYTLFLYTCIKLLKEEGILVFIVPDTFLNLHMHTKLRHFILNNTKICEISLFPSKFFPNVNFGYSNLCIIKLKHCSKKNERMENNVIIKNGYRKVEDLIDCPNFINITEISQKDMYENIDHALFMSRNEEVALMINQAQERIGDMSDCITGFYSGNDKKYLRALNEQVKGSKKYEKAIPNLIYTDVNVPLNGISGENIYIPFMKGGNYKYYKPTLWFMDWSEASVSHYKKDKKARFQNSQYYFKEGLGVPMVSSSKISAALIEKRLLDQSIVGIFPHDRKYMYYLLAFFNSKICNILIRTINPSANNSANYIKKIPFIRPDKKMLELITFLSHNVYKAYREGVSAESDEKQLEQLFCDIYQIRTCNM